MKLNTFVDALHEAGWRAICDAQHSEIRKLHAKLFPIIAELEEDLGETQVLHHAESLTACLDAAIAAQEKS